MENYPYIYTSKICSIKRAISYDNKNGITYQESKGEHAIWAARVPFLPAMLSEDLTRFGAKRIQLIRERQLRFVYDLVRARENRTTISLRFISTPNPVKGQPNLIDIIFLGKTFSKNMGRARILAEAFWEKFSSNFPSEDPFGYPLVPITEEVEFLKYFEPIERSEISKNQIMEMRKFEDMPIRGNSPLGRVERIGDYIAHPFVPSQSFNPMGRFFMALSSQSQKCYVDVSIRPTRMFDQEIFNVSFMIGQFSKTASEDDDVTEEYIRKRSQIGVYVYNNMMLEREQLMMIRVHLVGEFDAPKSLAEALGSEMMGNADNRYPTRWTTAVPSTEEETVIAVNNVHLLEQDFWGVTLAKPPLTRLRYLATAFEVIGAFQLPVPPESGYMPGVLVRNEPFIVPMDELELREQARSNYNDVDFESSTARKEAKISLGTIYHRGKETQQEYLIPIKSFTRHALIAGSTGSGKSTTIKHLLMQLWEKHRIPFLVLYPLAKTDYRELRAFENLKESLLVFTVGDETTVPFRFNPFEVPENILVKTHISRLMDVFESAFSLQDPLPMVYRDALRKVYKDRNWNLLLDRGRDGKDFPTMSDFYDAIKAVTESLNYGKEVQDNVTQASVIRIGDLLENAGYAINCKQSVSFSTIMQYPTIMELGRIGSTDDISLIMGFLLIRLAEEIECYPRPADKPHITVVEEAHRLMSEISPDSGFSRNTRGGAGENFGNMLAEVRGYGEGIIIAEQIPTLLIKGAIGNTYIKIMHWLEDAPSYDLFSNITNLDDKQKDYARTLKPGFAITRSVYGKPVHLKVPEFGDQKGFLPDLSKKISDEELKSFMKIQQDKLDIKLPAVQMWEMSVDMNEAVSHNLGLDWALNSPMQTCLFCEGQKANKCPYKKHIDQQILNKTVVKTFMDEMYEKVLHSGTQLEQSELINKIKQYLVNRFPHLENAKVDGWVYCCLAHYVDAESHKTEISQIKVKKGKELLKNYSNRTV